MRVRVRYWVASSAEVSGLAWVPSQAARAEVARREVAQRAVALPPGLSVGGAARALHLAALPLLEEALALLPASPAPAPLLPYCPFPDGPTLARLCAQGVRLVTAEDGKASLFAPAGGWR